jgi:predicted  nucleic acid-binding Zn-ribbon protein
LEETRQAFAALPPSVKKKATAQLTAKYNHMIGIETRLERLNKSVAENEKRIRDLTAKAQTHTAQYQHKELYDDLKAAQTLQHHNSRLFKIIEQTEHKLSAIAKQIAQEVKHVEKPNERTHGSADRSGPAL